MQIRTRANEIGVGGRRFPVKPVIQEHFGS